MFNLTLAFIGAILLIIGFILVGVRLLGEIKSNAAPIITLILGVAAIVISLITLPTPEPIREFPAKEYSIDVKVTTFQGKVDSTYVIIPRKNYDNNN